MANENDELTQNNIEKENNKATGRNAADIAIASGEPHAVAAGKTAKALDKVTGGKSSEVLGKGLGRANQMSPASRVGHVPRMNHGMQENSGSNTPNQIRNKNNKGGEQDGSLPSSDEDKGSALTNLIDKKRNKNENGLPFGKKGNGRGSGGNTNPANFDDIEETEKEVSKMAKTTAKILLLNPIVQMLIFAILPVIVIVLFIIIALGMVTGMLDSYEDAIGISQVVGEENGNMKFNPSSKEQADFYERVNNVRLSYQANGKTVDALKIVAVYHTLNKNDSSIKYADMTDSAIREIADAMFSDNIYSEEVFRSNLENSIFVKYFPKATSDTRKRMVEEVFKYIKDYYNLIGKKNNSSCASGGTCTYDIKGFYIQGKGNVSKQMNIENLYVRLMQCGNAGYRNYGGTWGQPIQGEKLVPFEKYVLGAAYAEIGDVSEQAFKTQLVVARSFILARHVDMGGWHTLKQEADGKWVMQVANCTADQLYCNPDEGCSWDAGKSHLYSGTSGAGGVYKKAFDENSPYRQYAQDTLGEVLVNSQGYVIYTGFKAAESNSFMRLAKQGYDYKQILIQTYNGGTRNYGASSVEKANCGGSSGMCAATGEYAGWKQYEGEWINVQMGSSGKTIRQIGCLVTSIAIQIAKSGVQTNVSGAFNPGTFVQFLSNNGGFDSGGSLVDYTLATRAAPDFKYQGRVDVMGLSRAEKLAKIKELLSQGAYIVAEVKGNTGQHWVAIDSVEGDNVKMMDPGSKSTDMWSEYNWANTSILNYYKVQK